MKILSCISMGDEMENIGNLLEGARREQYTNVTNLSESGTAHFGWAWAANRPSF